jgi:hypothetical protein
VPSSGYPGYANHPWHHYLAGGPASLLGLVLPLLVIAFFALLSGTGRWGVERARAQLSRRKARAASPRAVTLEAHSVPPVLASDSERDQAASLVSLAVGEGRLSIEEGVQRIDAVLRSRHRHEIGSLVADLPTRVSATTTRPFTFTPLRMGLLIVVAAVIFAAVLVQALVGLWELWPLAVVALGASTLLPRRSTRELRGLTSVIPNP